MAPKKDQVKEKNQNIQVAVRCRPINRSELNNGCVSVVECSRDNHGVSVKERPYSSKNFTFDRVFGPHSKQTEVYQAMVVPMVDEVLLGYNCTIFAYGQTGTGKTFTMIGERSDELQYSWENDPTAGIVPRTLSHIFTRLNEMEECEYSVRVSFLELFNEELFDLMANAQESNRLAIYDDTARKGSVFVKGLQEVSVLNKEDVYHIIEKGMARRQTASTLLNAQSSRSHSVFTVTVHMKENTMAGEELVKIGKLNLVDLAGSENIGRSGAVEKRAREAGSINQSLLTLGRVITALVEHTPHVPYRESKLTRLLQDSLGGRTKTSIIATISPSASCLEETLCTLDYAHRAKNIENRPEVNQRLSKKTVIRGYTEELERLRRDLEATRQKNGIYVDEGNYTKLQTTLEQQRDRITNLEELKECLTDDLAKTSEMFALTQMEFSEMRDVKEAVEGELAQCRKQLDDISWKLMQTERQRRAALYVGDAYAKTESTLSVQAKQLLGTADQSTADVHGLHAKVDRFRGLEARNLERLSALVREHADQTGRVGEGLAETRALVEEGCRAVVQRMGDHEKASSSLAHDLRSGLSCLLADVESGRHRAVDSNTMAEEQRLERLRELAAEESKSGGDLVARMGRLMTEDVALHRSEMEKMWAQLRTRLVDMETLVNEHEESMKKLVVDTCQKVAYHFDEVSQQTVEFSEMQAAFLGEIMADMDKRNAEEEQIVTEALQQASCAIKAQRSQSVEMFRPRLSSVADQQLTWAQTKGKAIGATSASLSGQLGSIEVAQRGHAERQQSAITALTQKVIVGREASETFAQGLALEVKGWSKQVEACSRAVDEAVDTETEKLKDDGKELKDDLKKVMLQLTNHCSGLTDLSTNHEAMAAEHTDQSSATLDDLSAQVASALVRTQDEVECLSTRLNSFLGADVERDRPTGKTPVRREWEYPRQLAATARRSHLLAAFNANYTEAEVDLACQRDLPGEEEEELLEREEAGVASCVRGHPTSSGISSYCPDAVDDGKDEEVENTVAVDTSSTPRGKQLVRSNAQTTPSGKSGRHPLVPKNK